MTNKAVEKDGVKYFACRQCGELKPLNKENFYVNTRSILGFNSSCRCCLKGKYKPKVKYITRDELEEENKELKKELNIVRNVNTVNVETLDNMYGKIIDLKQEIKDLKKDLEHRDSFFSIMRDTLANEDVSNDELSAILYCVIHYECGDDDMSGRETRIAKRFWKRKYV